MVSMSLSYHLMSRFISHILVCNVHDIFRAKNKKMIERSYKQSAEAEGLTKNIATSLSDANSKLSVSTADQANNRGKFETYINDLTITTQKKYEDANGAAQSNGKPALTAKKFLEAKNSAIVEEEEVKTFKILQDTEVAK